MTLITVAASCVSTVAIVLGVIYAARQIEAQRDIQRVQRVIDLHRDLTTGEVGAARDRLSTLMWNTGIAQAGRCSKPNVHEGPWQPTFRELLDVELNQIPGLASDEIDLAKYPSTTRGSAVEKPLPDLYMILWCFERIEGSRRYHALDVKLLKELIGHHAVWWDRLLVRIGDTDTRHRVALRTLAKWALEHSGSDAIGESLEDWLRRDFDSL